MEHSSFHPPISHFFFEDKDKIYKYHGYCHYKMKVRGNSFVQMALGQKVLTFKDGDKYEWNYPENLVSGLIFGKRLLHVIGNILIKNLNNNIECLIEIYEGSGWFSSDVHLLDHVEGVIRNINDHEEVFARVEGSYMK